jgi:hypothetical protein
MNISHDTCLFSGLQPSLQERRMKKFRIADCGFCIKKKKDEAYGFL